MSKQKSKQTGRRLQPLACSVFITLLNYTLNPLHPKKTLGICPIGLKMRIWPFNKWTKRPDMVTKWRHGFLEKKHHFQGSICPPNMDKKGAGIIVHQPCSFTPLNLRFFAIHHRIIDPHVVAHPRPCCVGLIALADTDGQSDYRNT